MLADGRVWYVDYAKGMLGVYDPASKDFTEWQMPQGVGARPYGMAADASGNLWVAASGVQPNVLVGFNTRTETFFGATEIQSGGGTIPSYALSRAIRCGVVRHRHQLRWPRNRQA